MKDLIAGLLIMSTLFLPGVASASTEKILTLGVLAYRPEPEVRAKWQPLADYLTGELPNIKVRMEVLNYAAFEDALKSKRLDFILTNPGHYVFLYHQYNLSGVLATLVENDNGTALEYFGGVIFTRNDRSDINQLGDLKRKRIASVAPNSLGGYQAQAFELRRAGIRLPRDSTMLFTEMPHDAVVRAVMDGKADAGFVRTGVLESMAREGGLDLTRLKILHQRSDPSFPFIVSTRLYPEWPFAALQQKDDEVSRHVAAALLRLKHDSIVPRKGGYWGFTIPADYSPVEELLRELRLPPYDKSPEFTVRDIWQRYRAALIVLSLAILITGALLITIVIINWRLAAAQKTAEEHEQYYRALFESSSDGLIIADFSGTILDINSVSHKRLGYTKEEMASLHLSQLNHPTFAPLIQERIALLQERGQLVFETAHVRKDGTAMPVEINATRIDYKGNPAILAAVRDLTERKKTDQEREKLITELQKALAQIRTLHGMLPICAICKKIRNDQGTWQKLESYISEHTDADFTHSICDDCAKKHYPRFSKDRLNQSGQ